MSCVIAIPEQCDRRGQRLGSSEAELSLSAPPIYTDSSAEQR